MRAAFLLPMLVACSSGQLDHERLGDQAWHDARWPDAVSEYRAAGDTPRLLAKTADAALQGGMLVPAAEAWTRLAASAPERAGEAAAGLAQVAAAAERDGDQTALAQAVASLGTVAPGWPLGRLAMRLAPAANLRPADAAQLLPAALATALGRSAGDVLLAALGRADRASGACDHAVPVIEDLLRRSPNTALRDSATVDLAWCELDLGLSRLSASEPGDAERWLERATQHDPDGVIGRRAQLAIGDARLRQGDPIAATNAWRSVVQHVPPDSLTQVAWRRLAPSALKADSVQEGSD